MFLVLHGQETVLAEDLAERLEGWEGEDDVTVGGLERAVGRADVDVCVRLLGAGLRQPADGVHRQLLHLEGGDGVEHVHRHELSLAGAFTVQQRGEHPLERGGRGDGVHEVLTRGAGASPARPVESMAPDIAWSSRSWPGRWA